MNTARFKRFIRRAFSWLLLIFAIYLVLESGSFIIYRVAEGRLFAFEEAWNRLENIAGNVRQDALGNDVAAPTLPLGERLYPYLGYGPPDALKNIGGDYRARSQSDIVVAITGGSVAHNLARRPEAMKQLQEILVNVPEYQGKTIRTVSLALPSYKQPQQVIALLLSQMFGERIDILINLDGYNEGAHMQSLQDRGIFYGYPYIWGELMAGYRGPEETRVVGKALFLKSLRQEWAEWVEHISFLRYSITAMVLWQQTDRLLDQRIRLQLERFASQKNSAAKLQRELISGPYRPLDKEQTRVLAAHAWAEGSLMLQSLAEQYHIRYYHFLQPVPSWPGGKLLSDREKAEKFDSAAPFIIPAYRKILAESPRLTKAGVKFYSLLQVFEEMQQTLYVDHCCHLNQAGEVIVARAMGKAIADDIASGRGD